jgi:hypothetical protein
VKLRKPRQDSEFVEGGALRDAMQRPLGEKIHRDQHSREKCDKCQR